MSQHRIHVFGASGSGTSTLRRALAQRFSLRHLDSDDYYWQQTNPPYTTKRAPDECLAALLRDTDEAGGWVSSGSLVGWGDSCIPRFTLAIFVTLARDIRLERLRARERERYGAHIEAGGEMHEASQAFLAWTASYDSAGFETRSLVTHEAWLEHLDCPVMRVQSLRSTEEMVNDIVHQLEA